MINNVEDFFLKKRNELIDNKMDDDIHITFLSSCFCFWQIKIGSLRFFRFKKNLRYNKKKKK